ncbi:MAG: CvpA family protein [Planctomycetes bacterium]|nr:CvpA family protein [Planctomycetota bacterium]
MIMNILAIAIVGGVAYTWGSRGGFSSLLNCMCVVLAGAIAFGLWEHVATWLVESAGSRGMSSLGADIAWGAGLAIPFAIALAILRGITDGLIRKNLKFSPASDWIVGSIFGVVSGVIISGVSVLALSGMRLGSDAWGYQAIVSDSAGNVQRGSALWVPTDRITAALYARMSRGTFSTSEPLAEWNADPAVFQATVRASFTEGTGRTTVNRKDFEILGRYVLDPAKMQLPAPVKDPKSPGGVIAPSPTANDIRADSFDPTPQNIKLFEGETPGKDARLYGVLVKFRAGAKERTSGQVTIGNGQVFLQTQDSAGEPHMIFPIAVISKAEAGKLAVARFRYDAKDTFLSSLGGDSESSWAFEFVVPADQTPIAIVVKGTRVRFDPSDEKLKPVEFESRAKRDALIAAGQLTSGKAGGTIDDSKAVVVTTGTGDSSQAPAQVTNQFGFVLQDGTLGSGITVTNGKVVAGKTLLTPKDTQNRGVDQNLRVDRFSVPDQITLIIVDVGYERGEGGLTGAAAREAQNDTSVPATPFVIDSNGIRYDAVGYIYQDPQKVEIRYIIGEPIQTVDKDLPSVSRSRPDQKLRLVFAPSTGTEIVGWGVGNKLVAKFQPPFKMDVPQK